MHNVIIMQSMQLPRKSLLNLDHILRQILFHPQSFLKHRAAWPVVFIIDARSKRSTVALGEHKSLLDRSLIYQHNC